MDRGAWWATAHEVTQSRTQIEATEHTCLTFLAFSVSSAVKNPPARKETQEMWVRSLGRKKWQPTPLFLPGESHGQRSLVDCNP